MSVLTILEAVSPPPPDTTIVTTLSELTNALNAGNLDITLTELVTTPEGGVNVPRTGGRVLRCSGLLGLESHFESKGNFVFESYKWFHTIL